MLQGGNGAFLLMLAFHISAQRLSRIRSWICFHSVHFLTLAASDVMWRFCSTVVSSLCREASAAKTSGTQSLWVVSSSPCQTWKPAAPSQLMWAPSDRPLTQSFKYSNFFPMIVSSQFDLCWLELQRSFICPAQFLHISVCNINAASNHSAAAVMNDVCRRKQERSLRNLLFSVS